MVYLDLPTFFIHWHIKQDMDDKCTKRQKNLRGCFQVMNNEIN